MTRPETIAPVSTPSIFVSRVAEKIRDIVGECRDCRDEQQKGKDYENSAKGLEFVHGCKRVRDATTKISFMLGFYARSCGGGAKSLKKHSHKTCGGEKSFQTLIYLRRQK